jgi:hypothetical protein
MRIVTRREARLGTLALVATCLQCVLLRRETHVCGNCTACIGGGGLVRQGRIYVGWDGVGLHGILRSTAGVAASLGSLVGEHRVYF